MRFHGQSRGHCSIINYFQIQFREVEGGPDGSKTEGRKQLGQSKESIAVAATAEAESTDAEFHELVQIQQIHEVSIMKASMTFSLHTDPIPQIEKRFSY